MQMEKAAELHRAWKARGNPPCEHPNYEQEHYLGSRTNYVCINCGAYIDPRELKETKPNRNKILDEL